MIRIIFLLSLSFALPAEAQTPFSFREVTQRQGLKFVHNSPPTAQRHIHLMMGSGIAAWDYDLDGWPDLYCGEGHQWDAEQNRSASPSQDSLWQNRSGSFAEVTALARLKPSGYTMGLSVGDFDNDGFSDLYVNEYGQNLLYRNLGDGTFEEVAESAGVIVSAFGSGCAWVDLDGDSMLDLVVLNYVQAGADDYPLCSTEYRGKTYYLTCHPRAVPPIADIVFRNQGDGTFVNVTESSGLSAETPRQGLGIVAGDIDQDGDQDFYVANDAVPNQLWMNQGNCEFFDEGLVSGTALNQFGGREAGMGVVCFDYNHDEQFDLFVTNYFNETNTLYAQQVPGLFVDMTDVAGVGAVSRPRLAFGTTAMDINLDGWEDLLVLNGHVNDLMEQIGRPEPFAEKPQLFRNNSGKFSEISADSGDYFTSRHVGRSSAALDYDRDGRPDVAILHLNSPAALLHNETPSVGKFLQLKLVGQSVNRSGVGVRLLVNECLHTLSASEGYLSVDDSLLTIGVGQDVETVTVEIKWSKNSIDRFENVPVNQKYFVVEGRNSLLSAPALAR